jgi:hypothetical protein
MKESNVTILKVTISTLLAQEEEPTDGGVTKDSKGTKIPNENVANKIDLPMIFHPEVLRQCEKTEGKYKNS